ncbi:aminopeptidase N-like [Nylanderia fulva]|uniref:aminopeptidase N-like n=1 Tax=Nylanderia fulva TaxID=613905 RepID=UPI0010FB709E|nr:aminopeptidase N-like [Nylanderia fulva]
MDKENKCNLTEKMNGWMNHKNYPILKIIPNYAGCINISLENFDSVDSNKYNLWIPITYTTQKNPDFDKTSYRDVMWFSTSQKILCIDELKYFEMNDWIIINLQQAGYYRVNYDTENWNKIAKYLNSMEYTNIHVLNRAQIIDDAYHFLTTGQIDSSIFWKLANYLPQDKDYIAWYPMIKAIEYMSSVFPLPDRRVYNLKTKIRNILDELLQNIGYDENITDHYFTNYLRQEAAKWSCVLGNPNCQQTATSKLQQHLENRTINKLLPWWEEWTYCNGLAMSGDTTWNNVFKIHTKESNDKYLKFLSCSENINIIQNYIKLMISENIMETSSILRMLQYLLTNKVFQNGTLTYLNKIASANQIKPNQFWIAMQDALDEKINNKYNLTERMDGWMKLKHYPILKIAQYFKATYTVISLENFDSIDSNLWIPITYTTQNNFDFNISLHNVIWLKFTSQNLALHVSNFNEDEWIIVNLQQAGYYRVNYENENWNKIAEYLNSKEYTNIHVLNRAQIIDDAYYFFTTNQIDSSIFWKLMNYLSQERDYIAWYPMIKALEHMSSVLPLSDIRVYHIKEKMQNILNGLLENIGYEESNEDYLINCLKQEVIKWACIFDEPNCKQVAASKLKRHLINPRINILLPWWEEWTYCNGLVMLSDDTWHKIFNIYMKKSDNKYLKFLTCSENIAIIKNYMLMISENHNGRIKDEDRIDSFHFIVAKYAKNSVILDFILSKFETIAPREISTVAILIDIINHVYSEEQLYKIRQFVKSYLKPIELDVERKIKIRLSQIKSQLNCLQKLSKFDQIKRD